MASVVLANGYILFFFSKPAFWSFWRPGDTLPEFLITWFFYCLLGRIFLDPVKGGLQVGGRKGCRGYALWRSDKSVPAVDLIHRAGVA